MDVLSATEALWDQIRTKDLCKDGMHFQRRAKNHIRGLAFNLLNLDDRRIYKDAKKIKKLEISKTM